MTSTSFGMLFSYSATWSDRYAVHPCKIDLYDVTGSRGKFVPAADWWKPEGKGVGGTSTTNHASELQVLSAPGQPITTACTMSTCAWPMQLYIKEQMSLQVDFKNDWNLLKFPFDQQILKGKIFLVTNFARATDQKATELNITALDQFNITASYLERLYAPAAWSVTNVLVHKPATNLPFEVSFEVVMKRNSSGSIFKVMIPLFCLMMLTVLAANMPPENRLKLVALCLIAASNMLNPKFLGLPDGYDGPMPFLMGLVIVHMGVAGCLLLFTLYQAESNFKLAQRLEAMRKIYSKEAKKEFAQTAALRDNVFSEVYGSTPGVVKTSAMVPVPAKKTAPQPTSKGGAQIEPMVQMGDVKLDKDSMGSEGTTRLEKIMCLLPALIHYTIHGNESAPLNPFDPKLEYVDKAARDHKAREKRQAVFLHFVVHLPSYVVALVALSLGYFM